MKVGHDQLRDAMVDVCMKAYGNCTREPVVRAASQQAKHGENDGLIADFATKGVWEHSRDFLFDTEERRATFCPLSITVDGVTHAFFHAFLRLVSAQLSAKWR